MHENQKIAAAVLITFLFIIIMFVGFDGRISEYEDFCTGLWVADKDFCAESGVDSMMMYLGPETSSYLTTTRQCHLLINDDYSNQGFTMTYSKGSIIGIPTVHHEYNITPTLEFEEDEVMPSEVHMEISMMRNMIRIYDDDQLYGIFYKDHETTDICGDYDIDV